ncbi:MAG TPA: carboxypeptidase-like regulatory domain-containing protein [Polyangiaceae bacterium]|nr:carboxypeptidase-like regulatory domain-containing protein [Polyangiaceae bacterium]
MSRRQVAGGRPTFRPFGLAVAVVVVASCAPIVGSPVSSAPRNTCESGPCERYDQPGPKPGCTSAGRCEVAGRPEYPYVLAVAIPGTSFFAPNRTMLLRSQDLRGGPDCPAATCISLPPLIDVSGAYRVTREAAALVGLDVGAETRALPAQTLFFPEIVLDDGPRVEARDVGLPAQPVFAEPRPGPGYRAFLPPGPFRRVAYPAPPLDGVLPPVASSVSVRVDTVQNNIPLFSDAFEVGRAPNGLDDPSGESRTAQVRRAGGLDGFVAYLRDRRTERRVSSARALSGPIAEVRLDTVAENGAGGALRDGIDIVVAPSPSWLAVPLLVDRIIAGAGLRLVYPELPPPTPVVARVVAPTGGVGARVSFESASIETSGGTATPSLSYRTTVRTDPDGRLATVLPPGTYDVFVEPEDAARALGEARQSVTVRGGSAELELRVRPKARVSGRVLLSDGRPLANADIQWNPSAAKRPSTGLTPRPARTSTDDKGAFSVPLDEGEYELSVVPEALTGFPRLVSLRRPVGPNDATLEDLVVFAPTRLAWTIKDPGGLAPIARAVVRAFGYVANEAAYVEVGSALTDATGGFEMLVGPLPK